MNKQAAMDKIVGTIKSYGQDATNAVKSYSDQTAKNIMNYKPFNAASARSAVPHTALYGALAGALLEGGRVGLMNMLRGRSRYDDEDRRPSAMMAALRGALIGGGIGGVTPLVLPAALPHIADLSKYLTKRQTLSDVRQNPAGQYLPESAQNVVADQAGNLAHLHTTYGLPQQTISAFKDSLNRARQARQAQ